MAAQENHDKVVRVLLAAKANQSIATEVCSSHPKIIYLYFF